MDISLAIEPGDGGKHLARVTIGDVEVTVYESLSSSGTAVIDVDAPTGQALVITVNDGDVHRDTVPG